MKIYIYLVLSLALLVTSCRKNEVLESPKTSSNGKFADPIINISVDGSSTLFKGQSLKNAIDGSKLSSVDIYKDSLWANEFGRTLFVETDEIALMKNSAAERYIYAGSLLQGNSIADLNFLPIGEFQSSVKPITVSVSFQAKKVSGIINKPSLSANREFITNILAQPNIGQQVAGFSYSLDRFTAYDELKLAFGSNVKTGNLFGKNSSNTSETIQKISKRTGLYAKFIQKNFTLDLDIPAEGKMMNDNVDMNALNQKYPTYVSSITYGRMGVMAIESDYTYEEVNNAYNSAFKSLFVSGSKSISEQEKKIIDESSMRIHIIGADGGDAAETVNGFEAFVKMVTKGGTFSATNAGEPIYFSLSHLADHSIVKTKFKINIDTPPLYARLEYQNVVSKDQNYTTGDPQSNYGDRGQGRLAYTRADIYIRFYSDVTCTTRTFPPVTVGFNYAVAYDKVGYEDDGGFSNNPRQTYDDHTVADRFKNNVFKDSEILLGQTVYLSTYETYDGIQDFSAGGQFPYTKDISNTQAYTLKPGNFYKVMVPKGL